MKKTLSLLTCLCMIGTTLPMTALAEGEEEGTVTPVPIAGDQVWSEDFQNLDTGTFFAENGWQGLNGAFGFTNNGTSNREANIVEDASGNKYLHYSAESSGTAWCAQYMLIDVPAAAKDAANGDVFTFEADIKLDPFDASRMNSQADGNGVTNIEYNIGLSNAAKDNKSAYFTIKPYKTNGTDTWHTGGFLSINGSRIPTSATKHKLPTDAEAADNTRVLRPYSWNTYRFVVRKTDNNEYYTDVYLNGWYFYRVGQRNNTENFNQFSIALNLNAGIKYGGLSLDNAKFYYGVTEADEASNAKGKFTVDNYDFNDLDVQSNNMPEVNGEDSAFGTPILQGEDYDHALGALRRYNGWPMTLDIEKGVGGKSADDSSLKVGGTGRINFSSQVGENSNGSRHSLLYGTALAEGETLEIASDVMFSSAGEDITFEAYAKDGWKPVAIDVTPNYYGHGVWSNGNAEFVNHRTEIIPGLPLNKWIRLKLFITRGTSTTPNTYSIYADNIPIVENAELTYWTGTDGATLTGDIFNLGLGAMYFNGNASYDNITFNRYMGGETYSVNTEVPAILGKNNPQGAMPSIRGKVFAGTSTIDEILTQFNVDSDAAVASYTVRDSSGNTVSDTSAAAGGNYIDILTTGGEHLYVTLAANNEQQNISDAGTDAVGTFGDFDLGEITAENVKAGYGRTAMDSSVKLTNINTEAKAAAKYAAASYENNVVEFSFMPDADTNFNFGYDVSLIAMDDNNRENARENGKGFSRTYPEVMTITDGTISATANGTPVTIGSYKVGEWTKVKLVFNHGGGNGVLMSVNDGEQVKVDNGPWSYFYKLENVYLTLPAGGSVVVDNVKITEGAKADTVAPTITSLEDEGGEIILKGSSILASEALTGGFVIDSFDAAITKSSAAATARYIDGEGAIVTTANDDTIKKYVLVMDDIYTYYNVDFYNFDCITVDGTTAKVELIDKDIAEINEAKLITAVYDGDLLKISSITDLSFTADANGVPVAVVNDYTEPASEAGNTVRYYVWNLGSLVPLCSSVEK